MLELLENGGADIAFPHLEPDAEFHLSLELDGSWDLHESLAHTFGGAFEALLNTFPVTEGCPHALPLPLSNDLLSKYANRISKEYNFVIICLPFDVSL